MKRRPAGYLFNSTTNREKVLTENVTGWEDQEKPPTGGTPGTKAKDTESDTKDVIQRNPSSLRFSPYAWAKFRYMRDKGDTEVGAYAISLDEDPLAIIDIAVLKQEASSATVEFDDEAIEKYFVGQSQAGRKPHQYGRIWLHTHPANSAHPSGTDESTFSRVFGGCNWAVMAILAKGGSMTARLRYNNDLRIDTDLKIEIDYSMPFGASDHEAWDKEYEENVHKRTWNTYYTSPGCRATYGSYGYQGNNYQNGYQGRFWRSGGAWCGDNDGYDYDDDYYKNAKPMEKTSRWTGHMPGDNHWSSQRKTYNGDWWKSEADGFIPSETEESSETSSDDGPQTWPLAKELEGKTPEEVALLLDQIHLEFEEVDEYVCHYDEKGTLIVELDDTPTEEEIAIEEEITDAEIIG